MEKTKDILYDLHYNQKLSSIKISELYSVSDRTIRNWFKNYEILLIGNTFQKGKPRPENKIKSEKELERLRTINIGREPYNKGLGDKEFECLVCNKICIDKKYRRQHYCSKECRNKSKGIIHWNYKGNENRGEQTKRNWSEYKELIKKIHIRDNKCTICFNKGEEVHHLESWGKNEKLRFDSNNCILLCKCCHKEVHKICGQKNYSFDKFKENYLCFATNSWKRTQLLGW